MTLSLAFHIIFAAVGIGLPLLMVIVERLWLRTGAEHYQTLARKWAKATGILLAVGAVSGTALSLELGLLWPRFMELTGAVVGHLFGLEGYAFFIEAIFIGLYLHGWDRLSPRAHWWCGVVIAVSGTISGVLVLGVNAWMQLPVGFEMHDGGSSSPIRSPSSSSRAGSTWRSIRHCRAISPCRSRSRRFMPSIGCAAGVMRPRVQRSRLPWRWCDAITALLQLLSGDFLAKFVFQTQPAKFAAMEGQFHTRHFAPLRIGGWPDPEKGETRWAIEIPGGLSYLATRDPKALVPGLDRIPQSDWPNVELVHFAFQAMVGIGTLLVVAHCGLWATCWRRKVTVGPTLQVAIIGHRVLRAAGVCRSRSRLDRDGSGATAVGDQRRDAHDRLGDPRRRRAGNVLWIRGAVFRTRCDGLRDAAPIASHGFGVKPTAQSGIVCLMVSCPSQKNCPGREPVKCTENEQLGRLEVARQLQKKASAKVARNVINHWRLIREPRQNPTARAAPANRRIRRSTAGCQRHPNSEADCPRGGNQELDS